MKYLQNGVNVTHKDFKKLLCSNFLNIFGGSFSAGAISIIAIRELGLPDSYIPFMLGVAAVVAAFGALPIGPFTEKKFKRPILINASILRGLLLLLLALLYQFNSISLFILIIGLSLSSLLGITFGAASGVHTRDLVNEKYWQKANSKFDSLSWIIPPIATPIGGIAIEVFNPGFTLLINGISYIAAGLIIKTIAYPEASPELDKKQHKDSKLQKLFLGWRIIFSEKSLRLFFLNAMIFGGCLSSLTPLIAVFVLKDLELDARALSIIIGVPALAGFAGTRLSKFFSDKMGSKRLIFWSCAARSVWAPFLALSPNGYHGMLFILVCECGLMFAAGLFNPMFSTYRMKIVSREQLAHVGAAWPISFSVVQPAFLFLSAFMVEITDVRFTIAVIGIVMLSCVFLIPRKSIKNFNI